ncbi:MAG: hypothetical protein ABI895_24450 [Deltaproteobacteria bacterium]
MNSSSAPAPRYQSNLPTARERFLAVLVDYALADGWRSPGDFLRHFGPRTLMHSLAADEPLRVRLLTATTRVNERLAARKTTASAAEDLMIALEEGLTDPAKVLALIPPDDRVRYFDAAQLWSFLTEIEFWKGDKAEPEARERFVRRVTFVLESALREGVLRVQDIADGIGFKRIASCLPRAELQRVVEHALSRAREGQRLTEEQLLEAVPLRALMNHIPLEHTWTEVVVGRLARPMQFLRTDAEESARPRRLPPPPPSRNRAAGSKGPSSKPARFDPSLLPESLLELQRGLEQNAPASSRSTGREELLDDLVQLSADDSEETIAVELSTRVDIKAHRDEEDRHYAEAASELERVSSNLGGMGRLPASEPELTLPILLSIESMYAELRHASDDGDRYSIVRDAFPNQTHLRVALSALIQLLDPNSLNLESLREADGDALISMLLFAERRIGGHGAESSHNGSDAGPLLRPPVGHYS